MAQPSRPARIQAAQTQGRRPTALERAGDLLTPRMRSAVLLGLLISCPCAIRAESDFYLKDGDTVVFYGDSITNQRLYTVFIETFAATRFPGRRIRFVHSGWPGDRAGGGAGGSADIRLERDVIAYNPSVV